MERVRPMLRRTHWTREDQMIGGPLGMVLYGVALAYEWSFLVVVLGFGMVWFSVGQAVNISLIYTIDAYPDLTGEVVSAQLLLKSIITFFLSTFINHHMDPSKRILMVAIMGGTTAAILSLAFPIFIWGARLRRSAFGWRVSRYVYS